MSGLSTSRLRRWLVGWYLTIHQPNCIECQNFLYNRFYQESNFEHFIFILEILQVRLETQPEVGINSTYFFFPFYQEGWSEYWYHLFFVNQLLTVTFYCCCLFVRSNLYTLDRKL